MASREKSWAIDEAVDRQDRIDRFYRIAGDAAELEAGQRLPTRQRVG
jgi:hypothetical protein